MLSPAILLTCAALANALPAAPPLAPRAAPQPIVASLTPIQGSTFHRNGRGMHKDFAISKRQSTSTLGDRSDIRYLLSLVIDGVTLPLMLDTGSSDTYIYSTASGASTALTDAPGLPTSANLTQTNGVLNNTYGTPGATSYDIGPIVFADAAIADTNLTVSQLCFGLIEDTNDNDVDISGLIGLGFPLLSGFWRQLNPNTYSQAQIAPLVIRLFDNNQIPANLYSLVFDRVGYAANNADQNVTANGGSMILGGYPSGMSESDFTFVNVPIIDIAEDAPVAEQANFPAYAGYRWLAPLDGIYFNGQRLQDTQELPAGSNASYALIDSGTPYIVLPDDVVSQITQATAGSNYIRSCTAQFDLEFSIGGQRFPVSASDLLVEAGTDSQGQVGCQVLLSTTEPSSDIGPNSETTGILGALFMRNAATVFDYGSIENPYSQRPRIGFKAMNSTSSS